MLVACGYRPSGPWPRAHAWQGSERTHSVGSQYTVREQEPRQTHSLILDLLGLAALQRDSVTLVLETLRSDESLDLGSLGVRLLALALGLDLASNDVLSDLYSRKEWY